MKLIKSIAFILFPAALSASAEAEYLVNLGDFPDWFQQAMARETKVESYGKLTIEELGVDAMVKGNPKEEASGSEDSWYFLMEIGAASPVECYAFLTFDGPANSLHHIVDFSLTGVEKLNGKSLSGRFNFAIDADMVGNAPYLRLDTLYNLGEGDEKVSGVLKGLAAETDQSLQVCVHNEMGYEQAFVDVFTSFVQAFQQNETHPELYEASYRLSINGIPVGFTQEKHTIDNDGDIATVVNDAMITPVDQISVARSDSRTTEWSRTDGSLINGQQYSIENGELASQYQISFKEEHWEVAGEMQGKPINATLEYNSWLLSSFGNYTEAALLFNAEDTAATFHLWLPDADPTAALPVTLSKISELPDANLKFELGPLTLKYLASKSGALERGTIEQGGVTLLLEKMYSKGEPVLP